MRLQYFVDSRRLTLRAAAQMFSSDRSLVLRWMKGAMPSREKMRLIYVVTDGEVQPNDFYDLPRLRKQRSSQDKVEAAQ